MLEIIQEVTNYPEPARARNTTKDLKSDQRFYLDKDVNLINHLLSDTFYTKEYTDQIKTLLGDSENFLSLSLSDYKRKLIQSELDVLSHDDYLLENLQKAIPPPY